MTFGLNLRILAGIAQSSCCDARLFPRPAAPSHPSLALPHFESSNHSPPQSENAGVSTTGNLITVSSAAFKSQNSRFCSLIGKIIPSTVSSRGWRHADALEMSFLDNAIFASRGFYSVLQAQIAPRSWLQGFHFCSLLRRGPLQVLADPKQG